VKVGISLYVTPRGGVIVPVIKEQVNNMTKLDKSVYEPKTLLKPKTKKNPDGVTSGDIATVAKVEEATLPQTGKTWMIKFKEYKDSLALNKTNIQMMVKLFGDDTDNWIKQQVKLVIVLANNPKGGEALSIRIKGKDYTGEEEEE
jgi:hypothetical protein